LMCNKESINNKTSTNSGALRGIRSQDFHSRKVKTYITLSF